ARLKLKHRPPTEVLLQVDRLAVRPARVEVVERLCEPAEVVVAELGDDVDPVGEFRAAVDDAPHRANDDVLHPLALRGLEDGERIEQRSRHQRCLALSIAWIRSWGVRMSSLSSWMSCSLSGS